MSVGSQGYECVEDREDNKECGESRLGKVKKHIFIHIFG